MTSSHRGEWLLDRRQVLLAGGALVVSLAAAASAADSALSADSRERPPLVPTELDSWLAVLPDSSIVAYFGKVDVGLAIQVAIGQIVAEELDVACDRVRVVMGDTAKTINQGGASGSTGLELGGLAMRNAAAQARNALLTLAARRLRSPLQTLQVTDGVVSVRGDERLAARYGELIGGRYFHIHLHWNGKLGNHLRVTGPAPLKRHADYRVVGKSIRRADLPDKLFGREIYVTDVRVPGMMHGRMIRPPLAGARPIKVDETSIAQLRDVQVVWHEGLLGVVAAKEWSAVKAARDLRIVWSSPPEPFPSQSALYGRIEAAAPAASGGAEPVVGDVEQALRGATTIVAATYHWPFQSHASMGPACALADVRADRATIWTGDQKPHYVRDGVAALLGLPREKVHGIWLRGPGSYGRNDGGDAALDAAYLSRAVGKPVRVQGSRAEATAWDPKSPASVHHVRAGLDAAGRVVAFSYRSKAFSRENIASHPDDPTQSLTGQLTGLPVKTKYVFDVPQEKYRFPSRDLSWEVVPALLARASPLRTSHLRDPLGPQLNFASESFIDELAFTTHTDPVAFRLAYLADERGIAVIEAAATRAGWTPRTSSARPADESVSGRGVAYARRRNTHVAVIVEVEVNRRTGRVWPRRWTVAHDCGLIVNPDNLRLVIEGNILHATSRALFEEVRFDRRMVSSVDWVTYPILETKDAPEEIDIVLIDHKDELPMGAGEPASRPIAAAIANAVFDATGVRLRQAPLSAQRVKAALQRT